MTREQQISLDIQCNLDDEYFGDWDELTPEIQEFWNNSSDGTHCEGGGNMGTWCEGCHFCGRFDEDDL